MRPIELPEKETARLGFPKRAAIGQKVLGVA
jgi:hypothetical protein